MSKRQRSGIWVLYLLPPFAFTAFLVAQSRAGNTASSVSQ